MLDMYGRRPKGGTCRIQGCKHRHRHRRRRWLHWSVPILATAPCWRRVPGCMLHVACCMLHAACCMLHAACCMSHVACRMLHVACCMFHHHLVPRTCEGLLPALHRYAEQEGHEQRGHDDHDVPATCTMQHVTCNMQHATCNMQHEMRAERSRG